MFKCIYPCHENDSKLNTRPKQQKQAHNKPVQKPTPIIGGYVNKLTRRKTHQARQASTISSRAQQPPTRTRPRDNGSKKEQCFFSATAAGATS